MQTEEIHGPIVINGEAFDVIKPQRLLPGMVLRSQTRDAFARLGPKESTIEEQIHTVSLRERGFPVARVLDSGTYGENEWFFIEESLGDEPFHVQFVREYEQTGRVSDETFSRYYAILERYIAAQFTADNFTTISPREFVTVAIPDNEIIANYEICGGDSEKYLEALNRVVERLTGTTMGILQLDLNPFNVLDHGIIDFELVGYGPLGYDSLLVSLWHRWFTSDQESRYRVTYRLTTEQIDSIAALVTHAARQIEVDDPQKYMQEFLLIKTAWGFTSKRSVHDEPESKRAFYDFRAALLSQSVDAYLTGQPINVLAFPDTRVIRK